MLSLAQFVVQGGVGAISALISQTLSHEKPCKVSAKSHVGRPTAYVPIDLWLGHYRVKLILNEIYLSIYQKSLHDIFGWTMLVSYQQ